MDARDPRNQHPSDFVKECAIETDMYYAPVWVTGDIAKDLLLYNKLPEVGNSSTNRKPSPVVISDYAALMLQDEWYLSPQPIIFAEKDLDKLTPDDFEELIDGQQRLMGVIQAALVRSDIRVPFVLCFDAPSKAKWVLDMNKKRSPGDFMRMSGEKDPGYLAKAVKLLYAVEKLRPFKSVSLWRAVKLAPAQQSAFMDEHPALRQGLEIARKTKTLFPAHIGAVLFYLVHKEFGVYRAMELFRGLETGADMGIDDARRKVREFISVKGKTHRWDGFEMLALLIAATNAWLTGNGASYKAASDFNKLSTRFPNLVKATDMPVTIIVPANDPSLDARSLPK